MKHFQILLRCHTGLVFSKPGQRFPVEKLICSFGEILKANDSCAEGFGAIIVVGVLALSLTTWKSTGCFKSLCPFPRRLYHLFSHFGSHIFGVIT